MDASQFILIATIYIIVNCICMKYFYNLGQKDALKTMSLAMMQIITSVDKDVRDKIIEDITTKAKQTL